MGGGHPSEIYIIGGDLAKMTGYVISRSGSARATITHRQRLAGFDWLPVLCALDLMIANGQFTLPDDAKDSMRAAANVAMAELFALTIPDLPITVKSADNFFEGVHPLWNGACGCSGSLPLPDGINDDNVWLHVIPQAAIEQWTFDVEEDLSEESMEALDDDGMLEARVDETRQVLEAVENMISRRCDVMLLHSCPQ